MSIKKVVEARMSRLEALPFETVSAKDGISVEGFFHAIRDIYLRRNVLDLFVRSELKTRYKDSSLGLIWALIKPLVMLGIYFFAIGKVLGAERSIPDFAIFVFTGITLWGFFAEMVSLGTMSILRNAGLIKKIYLPREIFPLAGIGSASVNFLIQFAVLLVATVIAGVAPVHWNFFLIIPSILIVLLFGTAIALATAAMTVYLRDLEYLVEVAIMIGFWVSPIVYSYGLLQSSMTPGPTTDLITQVYLANPMTIAIMGFQEAVWTSGANAAQATAPDDLLLRMGISIVCGILALIIGQRIFSKLQGNFAQEI